MAFILYQITNLLNGKHYIGAHEGEPADSYMGSGVAIRRAIHKYGKSNFRKDILAEVSSDKLMYALEKAVVDDAFVRRPDTYNMCIGGFQPPKATADTQAKAARTRTGQVRGHYTRRITGYRHSAERNAKVSKALAGHIVSDSTRHKLRQRAQTPETQARMRQAALLREARKREARLG